MFVNAADISVKVDAITRGDLNETLAGGTCGIPEVTTLMET
jgi:hypothetical protein